MLSDAAPYQIFCGDCLDVLSGGSIQNSSVGMVLSDLPYGTTQNKWDSQINLPEFWGLISKVTIPCAAVVLTAIQPFSSTLVMSNPSSFRYEWIWSKNKATGHLNARRRPLRSHESVLVFCDETPPYFPQMTAGHKPGNYANRTSLGSNYGKGRTTGYGGSTLRYPKTVLDFDVLNNDSPDRIHETQKPLELLRYLIRTYSKLGDVVLDVTMGSGSTGVAAAMEGRRFIGIESDADHFGRAKEWISRAYKEGIDAPE